MKERYLHTMWCDDIRQEVGNKPSLMGVYTGHLVVPQLPMHLPRLGIFSILSTPLDRPFKTPLTMVVKRDDGHEFVTVEAQAPQPIPSSGDSEATSLQIGTGFGLGPLELPVGCKYIVVEATLDGETIGGNKLWVKVDPEYFAQAMMQPALPRAESQSGQTHSAA